MIIIEKFIRIAYVSVGAIAAGEQQITWEKGESHSNSCSLFVAVVVYLLLLHGHKT